MKRYKNSSSGENKKYQRSKQWQKYHRRKEKRDTFKYNPKENKKMNKSCHERKRNTHDCSLVGPSTYLPPTIYSYFAFVDTVALPTETKGEAIKQLENL